MDNLTHSLIGIVLGEGVSRARKLSSLERTGVLWTSVLANNLPDCDFLLRPFVRGGNLGYLLHHRGYTHTVALAIPLAVVAAAAGRGVAKLLSRSSQPRAQAEAQVSAKLPSWRLLGLMGVIGILSHISADFWNDYGVHPFWPVSNRWFYGGFIFIVEPLIWLSLLPFVYEISKSRLGRGISASISVAVLALIWFMHEFAWPMALGLTLWGMSFTWLQHQLRRQTALAVASLAGILLAFALCGDRVRSHIEAALPVGETELAISTTPAPGNPLCWKVILTSQQGDAYRARLGVVGLPLVGGWATVQHSIFNDPEHCYPRGFVRRTAPLVEVTAPSLRTLRPQVAWIGEFHGSVKEFSRLLASHCRIDGLMKFARIPFWFPYPSGGSIAGDLRYDNEPWLGFAEIKSLPTEDCPRWMPSWDRPSGLEAK